MVALYCGSKPGNNPSYANDIATLARLLSEDGRFGLVFGDGDGLMAEAAAEFVKLNRPLVPVTTYLFTGIEANSRKGENIIAPCIDIREMILRSMSNGTVLGPGGLGSLKEALGDLVSHQMAAIENKHSLPQERERPMGPLLIMNTANYYDLQIAMLKHAVDEGFLDSKHLTAFQICSGPQEVYDQLAAMYESGQWMPKNRDPRRHVEPNLHPLIAVGERYGSRQPRLTA